MSRALNLDAAEADVAKTCAKHDAEISSIETLLSGGTRVVLKNSDAAAIMRRAYGAKVLTGAVRRQPMRIVQSASEARTPFSAASHPSGRGAAPWKVRA